MKSLLDNAVKIRFVKNLDVVGYEAVCLWWVGEIHVDERLRDSPRLEKILEHEMKHYAMMQWVIREKSPWKRELLLMYHEFWDMYDNLRIEAAEMLDKMKKLTRKGKILAAFAAAFLFFLSILWIYAFIRGDYLFVFIHPILFFLFVYCFVKSGLPEEMGLVKEGSS